MNLLQDILVIDDEPSVTRAVVMVCNAEGMSITAVGNASEGLRYLEKIDFRLVLCDIMMHDLDGFQFVEELARNGIQVPVVMMTGYSTVENAVRSLSSAGVVDYIPKPFTADELLTVVRRALSLDALLSKAESAALQRTDTLVYVPCPSSHHQLGQVSWAFMEEQGTAKIGVSDLFLKATGSVTEFEFHETGEDLLQGIPCAIATSHDGSEHNILCPLSGSIIEVNSQVRSRPALVEKDPYFRGWLYRVLPTNPQSELRWLTT